MVTERRVVLMGAGGRDFHDFAMVFRDDPAVRVVAFTAAQIPGIADRVYPASLAGERYPDGIPIVDENELAALIRRERIDDRSRNVPPAPSRRSSNASGQPCRAERALPGPHSATATPSTPNQLRINAVALAPFRRRATPVSRPSGPPEL